MKLLASISLYLLAFLCGVLFIVFKNHGDLSLLLLLKILPTLFFSFAVIINIRNKDNFLLLTGLICSGMCDFFMELPTNTFHVFGIISNMLGLGLVLYLLFFLSITKQKNYFGLIPSFIVMLAMFFVIMPNLGSFFYPVMVYCSIFVLFIWRAITIYSDQTKDVHLRIIVLNACISLVASDALLSFSMFSVIKTSLFYSSIIMALWWIGLALLSVSGIVYKKSA